jgi:hypothetical protein
MDDFASLRDSTPQTASAEDVWPDLNPVEMVEHFAKFENYDENAPLSGIIHHIVMCTLFVNLPRARHFPVTMNILADLLSLSL